MVQVLTAVVALLMIVGVSYARHTTPVEGHSTVAATARLHTQLAYSIVFVAFPALLLTGSALVFHLR